jgi:hypothetical protein
LKAGIEVWQRIPFGQCINKEGMPMPRADILIVTVTPVESRAVLEAFDAIEGKKTSIGGRVYRDLGLANGMKVYLSLSEMGAGGLGAAAQAVQKASPP